MYRNSRFFQILKHLDKGCVKKLATKHHSDKYYKRFNTWNHLATMVFGHLTNSKSLRDMEIGCSFIKSSQYHLRLSDVKRSTLSDANKRRDSQVFRDIAKQLIGQQEIHELLSIIDSSPIIVNGRGSEWADANKSSRVKGLKIHAQITSGGRLIEDIAITSGNVNDITEAKKLNITCGKIYVFDKGYLDFSWWHEICTKGAYFVTRTKVNTKYKVIKDLDVIACSTGVFSDQVIELSNKIPRGGKKNPMTNTPLRLVGFYDQTNNKKYFFITNLMEERAEEIAGYYKQRWRIELIFKWLKQNLKITRFWSENENAIKIQIYTAIITYMLLKLFKDSCRKFIRYERLIDIVSWLRGAIFSPFPNPKKEFPPPTQTT